MHHTRGRVIDITSLADFDARLASGARSLTGWRMAGLDLTGHGSALAAVDVAQSLFRGCTFTAEDEESIRRRGAVVLPAVSGTPLAPHRSELYTPRELYDTTHYADSFDAHAYAWSRRKPDHDAALVQALHDHAIDQALMSWVAGRSIAGVMGGHALQRGSPAYADAARLGRALAARHTVATGGGPGAMEAANLGAFLSGQPSGAVDEALNQLGAVASFTPNVGAWVRAAFELVERYSPGVESLGIPTWFYGHEPSNPFATAIAKYVRNATREAVLLEVCTAGIVFLPGAGGTVQEIFQDACENYYADETSVAPMVLVGRRYWTEELPAWPLLRALARDRAMETRIHLVDTVEEAVEAVGQP